MAPQELPFTAAQLRTLRSRLLEEAKCMRAHGITHFPDPHVNPNGAYFMGSGRGVDPHSRRFQAAQQACRAYAPSL